MFGFDYQMGHQAKSRTMPFYCDGRLLGITFDLKPFIEARKARLNNKENHETSGSFLNSRVANKTTKDYNMVVFGTDMTYEEKIKELLKMNRGYITRKEVDKYQIPSMYLFRYSKRHNLKQIIRGFYAVENWIVDPYVVFQYTYPRFIYSFYSGIYLHNLGDIMPNYLEVTGPRNYRPMSKNRDDVVTHTDTVDETYNLGITEIFTSLGNRVKVYDKEKIICDLIRNKDKIEFEVYAKALNTYSKSKDKNIHKLMEYASIMKIKDKVRNQIGVILNADK